MYERLVAFTEVHACMVQRRCGERGRNRAWQMSMIPEVERA